MRVVWRVASAVAAVHAAVDMLIDTDPVLTAASGHDIDDDFALLLARWVGGEELRLLGITATFGNANSSETLGDATRVSREAGLAAPWIARGGDEGDSLTTVTEGSEKMASALRAHPNATVLCIGSMWTAAATLTQYPDLVPSVGRLVMLGGTNGAGGRATKGRFHVSSTRVVRDQFFSKTAFALRDLEER